MVKKHGLIMFSGMLVPLMVIGAVSMSESAEKKCDDTASKGCKSIRAVRDGSKVMVTYIKTNHTKLKVAKGELDAAKKACQAYKRMKLPGAGPFKVIGQKDALNKHTVEEYYTHDGRYYARYEQGYIAVPKNACTINIVPYSEVDYSDHVKLFSYKHRAVTSKKEKWQKTKLLDFDVAALAVGGLDSKMGLKSGEPSGKDVVAKVPCKVHEIKHAKLEMTTCQWEKGVANSHMQLPHALTLSSMTKWESGDVDQAIAETVDFNKAVDVSLLMPPKEILKRKFLVDEMNFSNHDD